MVQQEKKLTQTAMKKIENTIKKYSRTEKN